MGDGAPRPHPHGRWQRVRAGPCPTEHRAAPTLCPAHHVPGAPRRWRCHLHASGGEPPNPCIVARLVQAALPASERRWLLLWPEFSSREVSRAFRWSSQSLGQRFPGPALRGELCSGVSPPVCSHRLQGCWRGPAHASSGGRAHRSHARSLTSMLFRQAHALYPSLPRRRPPRCLQTPPSLDSPGSGPRPAGWGCQHSLPGDQRLLQSG